MTADLTRRQALQLSSSIGIAALLPRTIWALSNKPMDEFFQLDSVAQAALVKKGEAEILRTAKLCESLGHEVVEAGFPIDGQQLIDAFIAIWSSYAAGFKTNLEKQMGKPAGEDLLEPWIL